MGCAARMQLTHLFSSASGFAVVDHLLRLSLSQMQHLGSIHRSRPAAVLQPCCAGNASSTFAHPWLSLKLVTDQPVGILQSYIMPCTISHVITVRAKSNQNTAFKPWCMQRRTVKSKVH